MDRTTEAFLKIEAIFHEALAASAEARTELNAAGLRLGELPSGTVAYRHGESVRLPYLTRVAVSLCTLGGGKGSDT